MTMIAEIEIETEEDRIVILFNYIRALTLSLDPP